MPAYSQEQLSDDQLNRITVWIERLGPATGAHTHGEEMQPEELEATAPRAAHSRLALFAAKDGNTHDAEHPMQDLVEILEDEHVMEQAQKTLSSLEAGTDLQDVL